MTWQELLKAKMGLLESDIDQLKRLVSHTIKNTPGSTEIMAILADYLVAKQAEEMIKHFTSTDSKEVAVAKLDTYRAIERLLGEFIPEEYEERYIHARRGIARIS